MFLGIIGGLLGGGVMTLITGENPVNGFSLTALLVATLGALLVLFIYSLLRKK